MMLLNGLPGPAMDVVFGALGKCSRGALSATCKELRDAVEDRVKCLTVTIDDVLYKRSKPLPQLRELRIRCPPHCNSSLIMTGLALINDVARGLHTLSIRGGEMRLTPELFAAVGALSGLRELSIRSSLGWNATSLDGVAHLSALTRLELVNTKAAHVDFQPMMVMTKLRDLSINGLAGNDATDDLRKLAPLTALTRLELDIVGTRDMPNSPCASELPPGLRELNMTLCYVHPSWLDGLLRVVPETCSIGIRTAHDALGSDLLPGRLRRLEVVRGNPVDIRTLAGLERLVLRRDVELTDLCEMLALTPGCAVELQGAVGNGVTYRNNRVAELRVLARSRVFTRMQPGIAVQCNSSPRLAELLIKAGVNVGVVAKNMLELERGSKKWMGHASWIYISDVVDDASLSIWPLPTVMTQIAHIHVKIESASVLRDCLIGAIKRGIELRVEVPADVDIAPLVRVVQEHGVDPDNVLHHACL